MSQQEQNRSLDTPVPKEEQPLFQKEIVTLFEKALQQMSAENYEASLITFERVLAVQPYIPNAWEKHSVVLQKLGRYGEAAKSIEKAMELYEAGAEGLDIDVTKSWTADQWLQEGHELYSLDRYEEAITAYEQALVVKPDYHEALYNIGASLANLGRDEEAMVACEQALAIKPDDHKALHNKGVLLANLGRDEEAIVAWEQALAIKPDYYKALSNKGVLLANLGRDEEAIVAWEQASVIKSDDHKALYNKGVLLANLGRYEEAIISYEKALAIKTDFYEALYNRGVSLTDLGRYEEAIIAYERALVIEPDLHEALHNKGLLLTNLGRYEEAIIAYERALVIKPDYHQALSNKGISLTNLGRYEEAIIAYEQALVIKPDLHEALHNKGVSLANLGRYEEAIVACEQALAIKPDYHEALSIKGASLANLDRDEEAIVACEEALAIKPDYHEALLNKGASLANLGRYEEAIVAYEQTLAIKPDYYEALYNKGVSLARLGQDEEAIAAYEEALAIKPDYHEAWISRASVICRLSGNRTSLSNSISHLQTQSLSTLQSSEPHIIALEKALPHLTKGSIGWGKLHFALGDAYLRHSKQQERPLRYWREARRSYLEAASIFDSDNFPEERLQILQGLVRVELAFDNIPAARDYQQQGRILFEKLRAQRLDHLKPEFERKFASFVQLEIDLLIDESNSVSALEQAEFYKNRCLTWILDRWLDNPESPKFEAIQTLVQPKTALIYWHLSHEQLTTFILLPHQAQPIVIDTDRASQAQKLQSWLWSYNNEYRNYGSKKADNDQRARHPWRLHLKSLLAQLQQILKIETIVEELSKDTEHIILVPHRDLHRLPLHAFFPDTLTTYLPSAQIGLSLSQQPPTSALAPLLNIDDPDIEQPKMDYARLESTLVRQLVGNTTHLAGRVTANDATQALETHYNTLHFTGHGEYNHRQPENSALQLTDELLTVKHIGALDLSSYGLVCLASCETALTGTDTIATEYVGLVSAFLKAGAANVLSTLWQVEEIESTWFIVRFYQALLENQPPAAALKTAQQWLRTVTPNDLATWITTLSQTSGLSDGTIDTLKAYAAVTLDDNADSLNQPLYTDPFFWAGFTLTGRG